MEALFVNLLQTQDQAPDTGMPREACTLELGSPAPGTNLRAGPGCSPTEPPHSRRTG